MNGVEEGVGPVAEFIVVVGGEMVIAGAEGASTSCLCFSCIFSFLTAI